MKKVFISLVAGLFALVFTAVIVLDAAIEMQWLPPVETVAGGKLKQGPTEKIVRAARLQPDEKIIWYYTAAMWSYEKQGSVVTDRRVIAYDYRADEPFVQALLFEEIEEIVYEDGRDEGWETEAVIFRVGEDVGFSIFLATEADRDREVLDWLRQRLPPATPVVEGELFPVTDTST